MITTTDQLGQDIRLPSRPRRIVSLVPSITELLCDLGLGAEVVGCTKFCVHPASIKKQALIVGGTKQLHHERITSLQPDLIIANKEENNKEDILLLRQKFPVWVSEVKTLADATELTLVMGELFGRSGKAGDILTANRATLARLQSGAKGRALYLIWRDPYMSVGRDTYIHDLLTHCGYTNVCADRTRYPALTASEIAALDPQYMLLSSEPFPFGPSHQRELEALFPAATVELVDGELYSWYGSRLSHY